MSHSINAQKGVQAKDNSCYSKQNNPASFLTKEKNPWGLSSFFGCIPWNPMLTPPSVLSVLIPPAPQGTCNMIFHPPGKGKLSSSRGLLMLLHCLVLGVKWPSCVWDQVKTCEHIFWKCSPLSVTEVSKEPADSGPIQLRSKWHYICCKMHHLSAELKGSQRRLSNSFNEQY